MSIRSCCYKGCENVCMGQVSNGSFTLFQFPKDPVRRQQWMELGEVDPRVGNLLMCSDHFDHSKYLSVNPRRTVLVGAAVPFAYGSEMRNMDAVVIHQDIDDECSEEGTRYMYFDDADVEHHNAEVEEFQVESTIDEDNNKDIITYKGLVDIEESSMDEERDYVNEFVAEPNNECIQTNANQVLTIGSSNKLETTVAVKQHHFISRKRKPIEEETKSKAPNKKPVTTFTSIKQHKPIAYMEKQKQNASPLRKKKEATSTFDCIISKLDDNLPDGNNTSNYEIDENSLIDSQNITSFIFKGEEYVQMPKEYFVQEKLALLQKIKQYEEILKTVQRNVNVIDFSGQ